ncbi:unnamed protein product [Enterobius vermicularis]|uniref:Lipoprotein n=1 Tax=Enterobius vermicularis TaxID=51028 RepID=A0A0N4VDN2_ENTVE|nr:unnamed protein product [Enterobius vermicularis]
MKGECGVAAAAVVAAAAAGCGGNGPGKIAEDAADTIAVCVRIGNGLFDWFGCNPGATLFYFRGAIGRTPKRNRQHEWLLGFYAALLGLLLMCG